MNQNLSTVEKTKYTYIATSLYIAGAVIFVVASSLLLVVAKQDYEEAVTGGNDQLFY